MRLCALKDVFGAEVEISADPDDDTLALDVAGGLVADEDYRRSHLSPDQAEELARHCTAWAAKRRTAMDDEDLFAVLERLHRLGFGVGEIDDMDLRKWPPQAVELARDLIWKLEQAEDLIRNLGGNPPF